MDHGLVGRDWLKLARQTDWCPGRLAELGGVSLATLERHFHHHVGQCPREWLRRERMRLACELLERDGASMKQIATELAFKNQHHFSRVFKEFHGYPPKTHRKRMQIAGSKVGLPHPQPSTLNLLRPPPQPIPKQKARIQWLNNAIRYIFVEWRYILWLASNSVK